MNNLEIFIELDGVYRHLFGKYPVRNSTGSPTILIFVIQVQIFRVLTPCCLAVGYQRFRGHCCSKLSYHITTWHHNPEDLDLNYDGRENLKFRNKFFSRFLFSHSIQANVDIIA
jgi:hypothetical protein